jgi:hypothetical protein
MAWIEQRRRADGGLTARVFWRPGGCRDTPREWETFGAGSDAQNLARADGFKRMVEAAGQRWPDGWVKGEGFVRPPDVADPMTPPPSFDEIGEEYVRQIVDLSPGQRKRYLGQLQALARTPVRGSLVFAGPVTAIGEAQLKTWLIEWDRSLKTKANYHGLIYGVFAYAVKRGYLAANPAIGTAPKQSRVKQSRPELYTQYGFVKRHHEADRPRQARHLGTDTSRDYVYTEWDGVKRFVEDFLEGLVPNHVDDVRPAVSHRPDDAQPGPTSSTPAVTPTSPAPSNAAAST